MTRLFYQTTWAPWSAVARRVRSLGRRESFLGFYGPLSILVLLTIWAGGLIAGFALLQWGLGSAVDAPEGTPTFGTLLYMSASTFFTLGLGDVVPHSGPARLLAVLEAGTGFGFLALVIAYLPVLYHAFSQREVNISLLDARAGSPPTAGELLRRFGGEVESDELGRLFREWEHWAAELLEIHLSYPVLAYYRSQHERQSWLAALTMMLDATALASISGETACARQAQLTFAMARHAAVDLSQVLNVDPVRPKPDRWETADVGEIAAVLHVSPDELKQGGTVLEALNRLRDLYEPYVAALSQHLIMALPSWTEEGTSHAWEATAWS